MTDVHTPDLRSDVAIVVIGRNEGDRLRAALQSARGAQDRVIYVDSGSGDDSVAIVRAAGATVIELDRAAGYSAARARNAGVVRAAGGGARYIQMIDGDCVLQPGWIDAAAAALDADDAVVAVFGRRREASPGASRYNWLCDVEWAVPAGDAVAFGGDVLLRPAAVFAAGGYDEAMIAGEDIDLALRLRAGGGHILCLPVEMTAHDAAILHFGQWWRRTARAGHAFAQLATRHRGGDGAPYRRSAARILLWGIAMPMAALLGLIAGWPWLAMVAVVATLLQAIRIAIREAPARGWRKAMLLAIFLTIGKIAEAAGLIRFVVDRILGRTPRLIEYKGGRSFGR